MKLTNFFKQMLSNPKKIAFQAVEAVREFNVNAIDCSSVFRSQVLGFCFVIPFFAVLSFFLVS